MLVSCGPESSQKPLDPAFIRLSAEEIADLPTAVRFDAPMGAENGALTYNAQPFRITRHLGDDLNGIGGWNSDLGDPVYASGDGRVVYAGEPSPSWGNMVILAHRVPEKDTPHGFAVYLTIYAHLDKIEAKYGEILKRGSQLGTVGTGNGNYLAHLHFEIRKSLSVAPGIGYASGPLDRVSPTTFLAAHAPTTEEMLSPAP